MKTTRFNIAKPDIIKLFDSYRKNVFTYSDISMILDQNRDFWRLPQNMSTKKFISVLQEKTKLNVHKFSFPSFNKQIYIWGESSVFNILPALKPDAYFSHYSAMYIHNLTTQLPKTYYLNVEQSPKPRIPSNTSLTQEKLDFAFSRKPRASNNIAKYNDSRVCLLNGKNHNNLGIMNIEIDEHEVPVTDIERTLIDITVRPNYAGGVFEVLSAFRNAKGQTSLNRIQSYLNKMDFIYPYHQAIGFYLSKAGLYSNDKLSLLKKKPIKLNFYIGHRLPNLKLDKNWKVYYPSDMDS